MAQLLVEYPLPRNPWCANPVARGADGVLRYGNLNPALTELLDTQVHAFATREAVVEIGGPRLTYRELWHTASRIAGGLQEHGIGYGDRVAVRMPVGARWVQAFLGALLSGAVPVLVHDRLPEAVAAQVLIDSAADFVLDGDGLPDGAAFIDDGASLSELALLCYTSGGVGSGDSARPKGVELTNENLLSAIRSMVGALDLPTDGLRNLVLPPLAHASGCVDQLLPTFAVGGTVVLAPDPAVVAETIVAERIDMVSATPRIFAGLLPALTGLRAEGVRQVCSAGHRAELAAADPGTAEVVHTALREVFPLARQWSVWGATETSGIGLALPANADRPARDLLGFPFGGTELALWGPHAAAGRGELLCRGPNVTHRYWNDPQTTESRFTGTWFRTGNHVSIDTDGLVHRAD
ncbi:long-chain fatty acid--CoA ligase [Nocardia terpenica]|uniref:class I adenylate-forming enzyme family protein n=1 Tax=Nocardia terpenica TaxID=455432 RepID=UPI001895158C|nr:AMP-binding protein [Nocardia terpenica]MBF6060926.1 long-chain fatty acid--CoA ligase [Nocardia terpenica]MBF6111440.1 long-chain fatty acid--CoA ligase [Nocardia terpenica]MBF6118407.1 long-chain fatty acid--CoA ligase [Nocardia terpenica]MBF6155729.1 long-chain fatty acid--CoA ligase [Nocardia terpenica]